MGIQASTDEKRLPLYMQVRNFILKEISEGKLKSHDLVYTSQYLQKRFNVSKITTEKAFKTLLDEGIIYRIPGKGSFVSESAGIEEHADSRTREIAFVCPSLKSHHIMNIMAGAESVITERHHHFQLRITQGSFTKQKEILHNLLEDSVDGIIFYPVEGKYYDEEIFRMKLTQFPFVLVDKMFDRIETSYVVSDNEKGSYEGTMELIRKGHRNIAFFSQYSAVSSTSIRGRIKGFTRALAESGIEDPKSWVFDSFDDEVGVQLTYDLPHRAKFIDRIKSFIDAHPDLSAVLAVSPGNLSHVVRGLRMVDQDFVNTVELAIFDIDEFLDISRSPMLSINQQSRQMGIEAANIVLNQIVKPDIISKIMLDMEIKTI